MFSILPPGSQRQVSKSVSMSIMSPSLPLWSKDLTEWTVTLFSQTDLNGRCLNLLQAGETRMHLKAGGLYKIVFKTKEYFERTGRKSFYPWVEITFEIINPEEHYHIPLLISPYSFTTYRGS